MTDGTTTGKTIIDFDQPNTRLLVALAEAWEDDAARLDALGQTAAASMSRAHARELRERIIEWGHEKLTLNKGAAESRYSYSQLEKLLRTGRIRNAGEKGRPRIERCDLPRRPPSKPASPSIVADEAIISRLAA